MNIDRYPERYDPVHRAADTSRPPQRSRPIDGAPNNRTRQPVPPNRRRRRRSRRPQLIFMVGVCSVILMIISLVMIVYSCSTRNPLVGKWSLDRMTSYVFYEDGKGALVVPRGRYSFNYTMGDGLLTIDFQDENAQDALYEYEQDGDTLTLIGGNQDVRGTYVLQRQG